MWAMSGEVGNGADWDVCFRECSEGSYRLEGEVSDGSGTKKIIMTDCDARVIQF
jgi:hypothetical protein